MLCNTIQSRHAVNEFQVLRINTNNPIQHFSFVRTQLNWVCTINNSINHLFAHSLNGQTILFDPQWTWEQWQWKDTPYPQSSKTGAMSSDSSMSYTAHLFGRVLPFCRDAVGVFYSPSQLGCIELCLLLNCSIRGMPMGWMFFARATHKSQFVCGPYNKIALYHSFGILHKGAPQRPSYEFNHAKQILPARVEREGPWGQTNCTIPPTRSYPEWRHGPNFIYRSLFVSIIFIHPYFNSSI